MNIPGATDGTAAAAEHRAHSRQERLAGLQTGKRAEDRAYAAFTKRLAVEDQLRAAGRTALADALMSEHHGAARIVRALTGQPRPGTSTPETDPAQAIEDYQRAHEQVEDHLTALRVAALPPDTRPVPDVSVYDELLPSYRRAREQGS